MLAPKPSVQSSIALLTIIRLKACIITQYASTPSNKPRGIPIQKIVGRKPKARMLRRQASFELTKGVTANQTPLELRTRTPSPQLIVRL